MPSGDFKIEDADAKPRLTLVSSAVACPNHDTLVRRLFPAQINHGVRYRRVTINLVSARPKQKIARFERVQLERVLAPAKNRLELSRFADPDVLFARVARHVRHPALGQNIINEPGTIHSALCRISRAILISEIFSR